MRWALVSLRMTVRTKRISSWSVVLLVALAAPAFAAEVIEPPVDHQRAQPVPGSSPTSTTSPGVWSPAGAEAAYAWLRCDALGDNCTPIDFACSRSYTTTEGDVGNTLRVRLTGRGGRRDGNRESRPRPSWSRQGLRHPHRDADRHLHRAEPHRSEDRQLRLRHGAPAAAAGGPGAGGGLTQFIKPFPVVRVAGASPAATPRSRRVGARPARRAGRRGLPRRGCAYRRRAMAAG